MQPRTDAAHILSAYSTDEAARILNIQPQTMRAALCRDGGYLGLRPIKRANRFLAWPADGVEALARGETL